jgi:predicted AAA+ superfamily ATPase
MAGKMPIISITGPRQSGKTTLAKHIFPHYEYVNLESPETRLAAEADPKAFYNLRYRCAKSPRKGQTWTRRYD